MLVVRNHWMPMADLLTTHEKQQTKFTILCAHRKCRLSSDGQTFPGKLEHILIQNIAVKSGNRPVSMFICWQNCWIKLHYIIFTCISFVTFCIILSIRSKWILVMKMEHFLACALPSQFWPMHTLSLFAIMFVYRDVQYTKRWIGPREAMEQTTELFKRSHPTKTMHTWLTASTWLQKRLLMVAKGILHML